MVYFRRSGVSLTFSARNLSFDATLNKDMRKMFVKFCYSSMSAYLFYLIICCKKSIFIT